MALTSIKAMETWTIPTSLKNGGRGGEDEMESDVEHKQMIDTYACEEYLSKWLPKETGRSTGLHTSKSNIMQDFDIKLVPRSPRETLNVKLPSQGKRREKEVPKENKVHHERSQKTYFEAIKCSPMKLRQSIAIQNRPKLKSEQCVKEEAKTTISRAKNYRVTTDTNTYQRHHNPPAAKVAPRLHRGTVAPRVVEMTGGALNQLGSLCFKSKEHERRPSVYTTATHTFSGRMRKLHRSRACVPRKHETLVRCESVMIYPKVLVNPNTEKQTAKRLFLLKEAWEDCVVGKDVEKLPELNEASEKVPEEDSRESDEKIQMPQYLATPKIIVPFGESPAGENRAPEKSPLSEKDIKAAEYIPRQINDRVRLPYEKNAGVVKAFPGRKLAGMSIGVTRLEVPRSVALVTRQPLTSPAIAPQSAKPVAFRSPKIQDLFLGKENLPAPKTPSPRYLHSPKKRADFASRSTGNAGASDDEENRSGLEIGGTGLLKESADNLDAIEGMEDKKRVHFYNTVPLSRITY